MFRILDGPTILMLQRRFAGANAREKSREVVRWTGPKGSAGHLGLALVGPMLLGAGGSLLGRVTGPRAWAATGEISIKSTHEAERFRRFRRTKLIRQHSCSI